MKRNIDLTLKRDFENDSYDFNSIANRISIRVLGISAYKIPWRTIENIREIRSDEDLVKDKDITYEELIITGNNKKRKETKKYRYLSKNICECCGIEFGRIPWKFEYGLCKRCSRNYPDEKIPWRNRYIDKEKRIVWR